MRAVRSPVTHPPRFCSPKRHRLPRWPTAVGRVNVEGRIRRVIACEPAGTQALDPEAYPVGPREARKASTSAGRAEGAPVCAARVVRTLAGPTASATISKRLGWTGFSVPL